MTKSEIVKYINTIHAALKECRILDAINNISAILESTSMWNLKEECERVKLEYNYLLQYFRTGTEDISRKKIHNNIIVKLYELTDVIKCRLLTQEDYGLYYSQKRLYPNVKVNFLVELYRKKIEEIELLSEVDVNNRDKNHEISLYLEKEKLEIEIFNSIWASYPIDNLSLNTISLLLESDDYPIYIKSLVISAILLSLLEYYDESLLLLLINLYKNSNEEISIKAICVVTIILFVYRNRVKLSDKISTIIEGFCENPTFVNDIKSIIFLLVRSKNTDKLTKKVEEELMPKLLKAYPKVFDKFNKDSSLDLSDLESNPNWKNLIEDNALSKKVDELNKLQMEGADVFIGTFAHLKTFPFFNEVSNWFLPFHKNHTLLKNIFSDKENTLVSIVSDSKFFCDSDKYSFVASLSSVPTSQRSMVLSQFDEQNAAINEIKNSELKSSSLKKEDFANLYIQNLYRFFKLHTRKSEFNNPFNNDFDISTLIYISSNIDIFDTLEILADFYLNNGYYHKALKYYQILSENNNSNKPIYYQKIGFCYQNIERYNEAIENYNKYSLLFNNDMWNLRHQAACYKALKKPEIALKYYKMAEEISTDNISICLNIGHCLLELEQYDEALKYYYKIHYLEPNSMKAIRPIAWCLFICRNFEQSQIFYDKILKIKPTSTDYLNYGHLLFAKGDIVNAITTYKQSISITENNIEKFIEEYNNDKSTLIKVGVKESDISILLDTILFEFNK